MVILHADPKRGGAEKYTIDAAGALANRGHEVSLLATTHACSLPNVSAVPMSAPGGTKTGRYRALLSSLDEHLKQVPYDVVHAMLPVRTCDLYHPHAGFAAAALAKGHQKHSNPAVRGLSWLCNQTNIRRRTYASVEVQLLNGQNAPGILCLSEYVRASARQQYSLPAEKLHLLYNAVDLAVFDPHREPGSRQALRARLGLPPEQPVALMVAQDFSRKGLATTIRAMEQLPRKSLTLVVAGRDDPAPYLRQAKGAGLDGEVLFVGATSDVRPFYQAADFMVLPTRHDPCSLVVLEALAMGLPVISTRLNGACEVMRDGEHGFVLPDPGDISRLADTMRLMLESERRRKMSQACLSLRPMLDYNNHIEELIRIYRTVQLSRGSRVRGKEAALPW